MANGEHLYTLDEAAKALRVGECRMRGHNMLWVPVRREGRPEFDDNTYFSCVRCSAVVRCTYPAGIYAPATFRAARIKALRDECTRYIEGELGRRHKLLRFPLEWLEGHEMFGKETYACQVCDVLVEVIEYPS